MLRQSNFLLLMTFLVLAFTSANAQAEQKITKGDWDIHYIAFPSSFLDADVAKQYGLQRSRYMAVINISVLDNSNDDQAQNVFIKGTAKNQLGQTKSLEFEKVREDKAIYYLSQLKHIDREVYNIKIEIQRGDRIENIEFSKMFYVD